MNLGKSIPWRIVFGVLGLVGMLVATLVFTTGDKMTDREQGLLQFIFFVGGAFLAWDIGRQSIKAGAHDVLVPHGKKAVRRIVTLASGLQGLVAMIQSEREVMRERGDANDRVPVYEVERTFDILDIQIDGQLRMVSDAVEDWRDVVPDEVESLERDGSEPDG
jgi:hypothetical protein